MKRIAALLTAAFLGTSAGIGSFADDQKVVTQFSLLIGKPSAEVPSANGSLLASGTVIPLDDQNTADWPQGRLQIPLQLAGKLKDALRLASVDVRYASLTENVVGERNELLVPDKRSAISIFATLQGFDSSRATYRIEFHQGEALLADSSLSVEMGKQAVVGALGGDEAPYLFLAVAPRSVGALPEPPLGAKPSLLDLVLPVYPPDALRSKASGKVELQMTVQRDGAVAAIEILKSPSPSFSQAAQDAVARWRYQPPRNENGLPVSLQVTASLVFKLD